MQHTHRVKFYLFFAMFCDFFGFACSGPTHGLGYRARRAAENRDLHAIQEIMEEAHERGPSYPLDMPERTVLTHFLEMADHPAFMSTIENWKRAGFIDDKIDCAVYRAIARRTKESDRRQNAAFQCIDIAREAALPGSERSWALEACLESAPFLVETRTEDLIPFLKIAADASEPPKLRVALLRAMTETYVQEPEWLISNDPKLSKEAAIERYRELYTERVERLAFVIEALEPWMDQEMLSTGTYFSALELERASQRAMRSIDEPSFFVTLLMNTKSVETARVESQKSISLKDWPARWVRSAKAQERNLRLVSLGVWDFKREPRGDVEWFVCQTRKNFVLAKNIQAPLGGEISAAHEELCEEQITVPQSIPEQLSKKREILGPYPLASTARSAAKIYFGR